MERPFIVAKFLKRRMIVLSTKFYCTFGYTCHLFCLLGYGLSLSQNSFVLKWEVWQKRLSFIQSLFSVCIIWVALSNIGKFFGSFWYWLLKSVQYHLESFLDTFINIFSKVHEKFWWMHTKILWKFLIHIVEHFWKLLRFLSYQSSRKKCLQCFKTFFSKFLKYLKRVIQ